jgi:predicted outer membrane repeat protein
MDCVFAENTAQYGGAIAAGGSSHLEIGGATIADNTGSGAGGGLYLDDAEARLEDTIIAFSDDGEAVTCANGGSAGLECCDVYGNAGGDWVGCIAGQAGGPGNISEDPLFCGLLHHESPYMLHADSPCSEENNPECGQIGALGVGCSSVGIDSENDRPQVLRLHRAEPNPFGDETGIRFDLPRRVSVSLRIYDVSGRLVRSLLSDASMPPSRHVVTWDGTDDVGRRVQSGAYFCRLDAGPARRTIRLLLVR